MKDEVHLTDVTVDSRDDGSHDSHLHSPKHNVTNTDNDIHQTAAATVAASLATTHVASSTSNQPNTTKLSSSPPFSSLPTSSTPHVSPLLHSLTSKLPPPLQLHANTASMYIAKGFYFISGLISAFCQHPTVILAYSTFQSSLKQPKYLFSFCFLVYLLLYWFGSSFLHGMPNKWIKYPREAYPGPSWHSPQTLHRTTLLSNKWMQVESHTVLGEDGKIHPDWIWMDVIDHLNVMVYVVNDKPTEYPQIGPGKFVMFRQKKYGIVGETLATVGGHIDVAKRELPLDAAKRELFEELGLRCADQDWISLGMYRVNVNRGQGIVSLFLATTKLSALPHKLSSSLLQHASSTSSLTHAHALQSPKGTLAEDELESQSIVWLSASQLSSALNKGEIGEVKWVATASLSLRYITEQAQVSQTEDLSRQLVVSNRAREQFQQESSQLQAEMATFKEQQQKEAERLRHEIATLQEQQQMDKSTIAHLEQTLQLEKQKFETTLQETQAQLIQTRQTTKAHRQSSSTPTPTSTSPASSSPSSQPTYSRTKVAPSQYKPTSSLNAKPKSKRSSSSHLSSVTTSDDESDSMINAELSDDTSNNSDLSDLEQIVEATTRRNKHRTRHHRSAAASQVSEEET